ncbi:putative polygalacturonase, partial [Mucuna pruriens]
MQRLITCLLILGFVLPSLCVRLIAATQDTVYNVMDYGACGDGKSDDSKAFLSAWQHTCGTQGTPTLVIPQGRTFMVSNIKFNGTCMATSIHIQLQGKIIAPEKNAWVGDNSGWIFISHINNLVIDGTGGLIDGCGSTWWACRTCPRPTVISFESCKDLSVSHLSITNSPKAHIHINNCVGATFSDINIHAPGNSPNTDGINIASSNNIFIEDSIIASGDDCIAIIGDSSYINISGIACGPGHGISIGSLGRGNAHNTVEEVYVHNCSFTKTSNGARIKTWSGGSGYAKRITFEDITLIEVRNPIIIDQSYRGRLSTGVVEVSEVTCRRFQGTSADSNAIILNCDPSIGCSNIVLDHVDISSCQQSKPACCFCHNAHGAAISSSPNCSCLSN